jgi:hypothetical protein
MITESMEKDLPKICKFYFAKKNCKVGDECKHSHKIGDLT